MILGGLHAIDLSGGALMGRLTAPFVDEPSDSVSLPVGLHDDGSRPGRRTLIRLRHLRLGCDPHARDVVDAGRRRPAHDALLAS